MHLKYVALHEVTWCMVVWCTQNMLIWQQFHVIIIIMYIYHVLINALSTHCARMWFYMRDWLFIAHFFNIH